MRRRWHLGALAACVLVTLTACGGGGKATHDLLFVSSRSSVYAIYSMNVDGSDQSRLTRDVPKQAGSSAAGLFFQVEPAWAPDGQRIAFSSNRSGTSQIYVMHADGTGTRQLTSLKGGASGPSWSPDGSRIAFLGFEPGFVYVMRVDGSGIRRLGPERGNERDPAWSPDGGRVAFVRREPGTSSTELWVSRPDGTHQQQLTRLNASMSSPTWSPDGTRLAFAANPRGRYELYTVGAEGRGLKRLTHDSIAEDIEPSWSPDGKVIAFSRDGAIVTVDLEGAEHVLTKGKNNDSSPAWRPGAVGAKATK
jgi:Tol biopolymer transport system component